MDRHEDKPGIKRVCEFFWHVEDKYSLLNESFGGLQVWPYARVTLYYDLVVRLGIGDAPHPPPPSTATNWRSVAKNLVTGFFLNNPLTRWRSCDVVMLEHRRIQRHGDEWIDVHSHFLEQEWDAAGVNWRSITAPAGGRYLKQANDRRFRRVALDLLCEFLARLPLTLSRSNLEKIHNVESEAKQDLGVEWPLETLLRKNARKYRSGAIVYGLLFRIWRPQELYVVVSYDTRHAAAVAAAKKLGIRVTEIQHGTISRFHLGYSYPDRRSPLPCFPDHLLVWSDFWARSVPFSTELATVGVRGLESLERGKARYGSVMKSDAVIVISQGLLADRIAEAFLADIDRWKDCEIRYKVHPSEYGLWKDYPSLKVLRENHGVEVLEDCDLYLQFAECSDQVGVFSTALYEGLEFGCKTFLLDLPGVEYMEDLVESGRAEMLRGGGLDRRDV